MKTPSKITKLGFTLVEVSLFLAISGLILVGVISSTKYNISRQRYNNSVEEYAEFLRGLYNSTIYIQNSAVGGGRSEQAIYGKLVIFDENTASTTTPTIIYTYDLIGDILSASEIDSNAWTDSPISALSKLNLQTANESSYTPKWGAVIKTTSSTDNFTGSLLIFRSPLLGTIYTYFTGTKLDHPTALAEGAISGTTFTNDDINFCIDSDDRSTVIGNRLQNIRLLSKASGSSAVTLINTDTADNLGRSNACAEL